MKENEMGLSDTKLLYVALCGRCLGFETEDLSISLSLDDFKSIDYSIVFDIDEPESVSEAAELLHWTPNDVRNSSNILFHKIPNGELVKTSLRFIPVVKG